MISHLHTFLPSLWSLAQTTPPGTSAPAATPAAAAPAAAATSRSLLDYINSGGPISYFLVLVSIVALALVITNILILRRTSLAPLHVQQSLERLLKERNTGSAIQFCQEAENDSFLARVMGAGLSKCARSAFGFLELRAALEEAGAREVDRLERVTQGVGLVAGVGPMLGLLGTVIGMIGAFGAIANLEGASRSHELAGYMSIALVTTAEGLFVAIPATVAFAMLKRAMERRVNEIGEIAERLAAPLMASGVTGPAARPPVPAQVARPPVTAPAQAPRPVPAAPANGGAGA